MTQAIFGLASIPLILIAWAIFMTYRDGTGNDWFIKFFESRIGLVVLLICAILVMLSIFLSYAPDAYWN